MEDVGIASSMTATKARRILGSFADKYQSVPLSDTLDFIFFNVPGPEKMDCKLFMGFKERPPKGAQPVSRYQGIDVSTTQRGESLYGQVRGRVRQCDHSLSVILDRDSVAEKGEFTYQDIDRLFKDFCSKYPILGGKDYTCTMSACTQSVVPKYLVRFVIFYENHEPKGLPRSYHGMELVKIKGPFLDNLLKPKSPQAMESLHRISKGMEYLPAFFQL